eukprot:4355030-Amphidinium_carterae.1
MLDHLNRSNCGQECVKGRCGPCARPHFTQVRWQCDAVDCIRDGKWHTRAQCGEQGKQAPSWLDE